MKDFIKKYLWYGKGDAQFVMKHPERFFSILKHQIYNYPIKISFKMLLKGKIYSTPFSFFAGLLRHIGMIIYFFGRLINKKEKIYST